MEPWQPGGVRRQDDMADYFDAHDSADEHEQPSPLGGDDVDPLDAFMRTIDAQVTQQRRAPPQRVADKPLILTLSDNEDEVAAGAHSTRKAPRASCEEVDSEEEVYAAAKDAEQNELADMKGKAMETLAPLDHATMDYQPFRKNFYTPHRATCALSADEVATLRSERAISVAGTQVATPVTSFQHFMFDRTMLQWLRKRKLDAPTAIQAQALPVALSGRDLLAIATTGSGKTLAFTLPLVSHVMDQRELQRGEGPIAIILAPTRELAHQTYLFVKTLLPLYGASCAAICGGAGKWEQVQALKAGVEVVVATPGRLIEMIRKKVAHMNRVTFVVLDEADRMFEMGFEPQVRSILGQIRPDRQTLMFSATFRRQVRTLALDVLTNPVTLTLGHMGQANEEIRQLAVVLPNHNAKWPWLKANVGTLVNDGRLLLFANSKAGCEQLAQNVAAAFPATGVACLHGDKTQHERTAALRQFKQGTCRVLVATDVAARGLDVKNVKTVVNYDVAKTIETHVHRIGRTGRMGHTGFEPGTAYTLVTRTESQFAAQLVSNMNVSGQRIPADLLALAKRHTHVYRSGQATRNATEWPKDSLQSQSSDLGATRALDANDVAELHRYNDSKRNSRTEQRQGVGFARRADQPCGHRKANAAALASAFRAGFVKSTVQADACAQSREPVVPLSAVSGTIALASLSASVSFPPPSPTPTLVSHHGADFDTKATGLPSQNTQLAQNSRPKSRSPCQRSSRRRFSRSRSRPREQANAWERNERRHRPRDRQRGSSSPSPGRRQR